MKTPSRLDSQVDFLLTCDRLKQVNRRNFLAQAGTAAAGALGVLAAPAWLNAAEPKDKTRIREATPLEFRDLLLALARSVPHA